MSTLAIFKSASFKYVCRKISKIAMFIYTYFKYFLKNLGASFIFCFWWEFFVYFLDQCKCQLLLLIPNSTEPRDLLQFIVRNMSYSHMCWFLIYAINSAWCRLCVIIYNKLLLINGKLFVMICVLINNGQTNWLFVYRVIK